MEKLIRGNRVAVLYSPGFGAGWYSWNLEHPELLFDPGLADLVDTGAEDDKINAYVSLKWPDIYTGGAEDLRIEWVPIGTEFRIHEYDGAESVECKDKLNWITA